MEQSFASQVARCLHSHQRKLRGYQVLFVLAAIVVFCTVYALMMPAVTLSNEVVCGMEAHTHSDSCYSLELVPPQPELICGAGEDGAILLHQHNEYCYNDRGELICTLPELESHVHGPGCYQEKRTLICQETQQLGHTHSGSCYAYDKGELTCTWTEPENAHYHTDACYETTTRRVLTCGQTEGGAHTHTDACYVTGSKEVLTCGQTEAPAHTHDEGCYTVREKEVLTCSQREEAPHTHDDSCYTVRTREVLTCSQSESDDVYDGEGNLIEAGHHHDGSCYSIEEERELTCGRSEGGGHTHDSSCYTVEEERELTCGLPEGSGHTHDSSCYTTEETRELACGQSEGGGHTHTDACYTEETERTLTCTLPEAERHVHTDKCYQWTERLICQEPESEPGHIHTDACYKIEEVLSCRQPELVPHTHGESCYDEAGSLTCGLPEVRTHQHTAACVHRPEGEGKEEWVLICGKEEHVHTDECYLDKLPPLDAEYFCGMTEHIHTPDCYFKDGALRCTLPEHIHDESCLEVEIPASPLESGVYLDNTYEFDNDEFHMVFHIDGYAPMKSAAGAEAPEKDDLPASPAATQEADASESPAATEEADASEPPAETGEPDSVVVNDNTPPLAEDVPAEDAPAEDAPAEDTVPPDAENITWLDSEDVEFAVEPLDEEAEEYQRYSEQVSELMEDEAPLLLQVMSLNASIYGEELDLTDCEIQVEVTLQDAVVEAITSEAAQPSLIDDFDELDTYGDAPAAEDVNLTLVACEGGMESSQLNQLSSTTVSETQAELRTMMFKLPKGNSNFGLTLLKNVYPNYTVEYYANLQRPDTSGGDVELPFIDTSAAGNGTETAQLPENGKTPKTTNLQLDKSGNVKFHEELKEVFRPAEYTFNPREQDGENALTVDQMDGLRGAKYDPTKPIVKQNDHYKLVGFWILKEKPAGSEVDDKDWEADEKNWIQYKKGEYEDLIFTNNPSSVKDGVILINEGAKFRLVYDPEKGSYTNDKTTFYDYDVTDGESYTDPTMKKKSPDRDSGKRWMNTAEQGINSVDNYDPASGQRFAFGNSYLLTSNNNASINQANGSNYGKCTFKIVDGIDAYGNVNFSPGITGPNIFGSQSAIGKTAYTNYDLGFSRMGDTYTLTSVGIKEGATVSQDLHKFEAITTRYKGDPNNPKDKIWSNSFWPMDSAPSYGAAGHDIKFGAEGDNVKIGPEGTKDMYESDDKKDHNSYFGMNFSINFTLPKEYVGPLEYYFYGDDDMWVFLDGKPICDIGGVHSSVGEYVDLWDYIPGDKYKREGDETYTLTFFYTERGASGSTCWMQYTLPNATAIPVVTPPTEGKTQLKVSKDVDGNVIPDGADTQPYDFTIKVDGVTNQYLAFLYNEEKQLCDAAGNVIKNPAEDQASFTLQDGVEQAFKLAKGWELVVDNLPNHAKYTVTEMHVPEGCQPSIVRTARSLEDGTVKTEKIIGNSDKGSVGNTQTTLAYTNSFNYELPETGGSGILAYTLTGALLPAVTGGLWYRKRKSRREGAVD